MIDTITNLHKFQFTGDFPLENSCIKEIKTTMVGDWFLFYVENVEDGYEFLRQNAEKNGHLSYFLEYDKNDIPELKDIKGPGWYGWYVDLILPLDKLILIQVSDALGSLIQNLKTLRANKEFRTSFEEDFKRLTDMYNFWAPDHLEKVNISPKNDIHDLETLSQILSNIIIKVL